MAFITLRQANVVTSPGGTVKGSPLTNGEVDNNFANLNIVVGFRENLITTANANLVAGVNEVRSVLNDLFPASRSNGTSNVNIATANGPVEVSANFIPTVTNTINLGSETRRFKDLYLTGNTINLGGDTISSQAGFLKINDNNAASTDGQIISSNVRLLSAAGDTFIELRANAELASNISIEFPSADGTSGQFLVTDSLGKLVFQTVREFDPGTVAIFMQSTAPTGWLKDTSNFNDHALRVVTGTCSSGGSVDFTAAFASRSCSGNVVISASMGNVIQGGTVTTGAVTQGGSISVSTGNVTQGGSVSGSTGQVAAPVTIENHTLTTPEIPSHTHTVGAGTSWCQPNAPFRSQIGGNTNGTSSTGGGGAHSHPGTGGQHAHPLSMSFTGQSHAHPASGLFTGNSHDHPSAPFTGQSHAHPISAPATFTGDAINLAVKYVDVIRCSRN